MSALCPMTTPGRPENVNPATSRGQSSLTVRQCSPICIQGPGTDTPRCGSSASSGAPVVVWSPETAQALLPRASPWPTRTGIRPRAARSRDSAARAAGPERARYAGRRGLRVPGIVASCSKTPSTTAPWPTIGACSAGYAG